MKKLDYTVNIDTGEYISKGLISNIKGIQDITNIDYYRRLRDNYNFLRKDYLISSFFLINVQNPYVFRFDKGNYIVSPFKILLGRVKLIKNKNELFNVENNFLYDFNDCNTLDYISGMSLSCSLVIKYLI